MPSHYTCLLLAGPAVVVAASCMTTVPGATAADQPQHAAAHQVAAADLQHLDNEACHALPIAKRATCPLLGKIAEVGEVSGGVELALAEGVDADAFEAHVRCHLAYAAVRRHQGIDECPLYVKGVTLERRGDRFVLKARAAAAIEVVQSRTAAHVTR